MTHIFRDTDRWLLARGYAGFVITSDDEMVAIGRDPSISIAAFKHSFVDVCESAVRRGLPRVGVSYDYFFGGNQRRIYPTDPECITTYKRLYDMAADYGLSFEASILSPLDLGVPWVRSGRDPGRWYQYQEAACAPDGAYRVKLPLQVTWFHNKGPCHLTVDHIRVFAFREQRLDDSAYYYVDPAGIVDGSDTASYTITDPGRYIQTGDLTPDPGCHVGEIEVHGRWLQAAGKNILAVVVYRTEEMDYFATGALDFLKGVIDAHAGAGIRYGGFYSDEMHIQWDWHLNAHIGHDEIHARYLTDGLAQQFASLYGDTLDADAPPSSAPDFARYLVYFAYHQHDFMDAPEGVLPSQHVLGPDEAGIARTVWLRRCYFHLLNDHVVGLFTRARDYASERFGRPMLAQAHATWQESPTCDWFAPDYGFGKPLPAGASRYDYTPLYQWSASLHEAVATGYNYFRWGDFLTGMGNDHPEGGNIDRNHYAKALAASFAALDRYGLSYCGFWGSPKPVMRRMGNAVAAYGDVHSAAAWVQGFEFRATPVLMLYPLDLFHVEERFGSWMVQYGYANYISQQKLLERARVEDGVLVVRSDHGECRYTHLVALFEPLLQPAAGDLLKQFVETGGTLVWAGPPATISAANGKMLNADWANWSGARGSLFEGRPADRCLVSFSGPLADVAPMTIGTDLRPDWIYPLQLIDAEPCAWVDASPTQLVVGAWRFQGRGRVVTLGFRPRDDQSASTGRDWRTLFQVLYAFGAYPGDDHPEVLSRTSDYLVCRAPNGAVTVTRQYSHVTDGWAGAFFRDDKADATMAFELPSRRICLDAWRIAGHTLSYAGQDVLSYRLGDNGHLLACHAAGATGITVDGQTYQWSDRPVDVLFAPVPPSRLAQGIGRAWVIMAQPALDDDGGSRNEWPDAKDAQTSAAATQIRLPLDTGDWRDARLGVLDAFTGSCMDEQTISCDQSLSLDLKPDWAGRLLVLYELL